ncbi:AMP-binding protein [Yinghuangia sp. YIM S09857]|uniref:AMP-binding protein n=1 Tax=Yinghuangia sp. YIM S09857 TaxID=3436929 RepID=UPI003F538DBA
MALTPTEPAVYAPGTTPSSIPALVMDSAERYGDAAAVVDNETTLSFRELRDEMLRVARAVRLRGLDRGDRAAIWMPNGAAWVTTALGLLAAGLTVVPVNTRYRAEETAALLGRTRARALFVDHGFLGYDHVGELAKLPADAPVPGRPVAALPDLDTIVCARAVPVDAPEGVITLGDFTTSRGGTPADTIDLSPVKPDDTAYIIFTSGTTGPPKGVQLLHGVLPRMYQDYSGIWGIRRGDRYLCPLPFFHAGGQSALLSCLIRGAAVLPVAVFDPAAVLEAVQRFGVTVMIGAPTIFTAILDHPDRDSYDLSSLRLAATGAAVVPVAMVERARTELPFKGFVTAYGLTECHGTATMCAPGDDAITIATTNGQALPGTEVCVVDLDTGAPTAVGAEGEVQVRGYHVSPGYLDDPAGTAEAFDDDGWLRTGDLGTLDEQGNLTITGRLKDLYITGGFNVSPAEVEQVLSRHPAVSEAAVIGVPDARLGEVGRAFVIAKPGVRVAEADLIAWCRERVANFKVPRSVVLCADLPRNATGKVQKTDLRQSHVQDTGGAV